MAQCTVCNRRDFELACGFYYCQTKNCGTESHAHGQDFVNEESNTPFIDPIDFGEDPDSNDEEDQMESDNESRQGLTNIIFATKQCETNK